MTDLQEQVPLAPLTTLGVGGAARFFAEARSAEDITAALGEAKRRGVGVAVLGGGSNTLVPDDGVDAFVLHVDVPGIEEQEEDGDALVIAGAGVRWDEVVARATARGLWGIENLAGIPGTIGGAAVQNIGAYGAELAGTFAWADVVERATGAAVRISARDAAFGYRESIFKRESAWVVTHVALRVMHHGVPDLAYKDLATMEDVVLDTPEAVAQAVRAVRAAKMPGPDRGSAGSFFKNPVVTEEEYAALRTQYPELSGFPVPGGVKVQLAWVLDHVLGLNGFVCGMASLHEAQPLILTTRLGATAADVDACAREVAARVHTATGIRIEREVETLDAR